MALFSLLVTCLGFSWNVQAAFTAVSQTLDTTQESCPNGVIDPGETNTVAFVIKNTSGGTLNNVKVSINSTGGVDFPQSGTISLGSIANNATGTANLRFRVEGSCGATFTPTLHISYDGGAEDLTFPAVQLGKTTPTVQTFPGNGITINDFTSANLGRATPYPSTISVTGVPHTTGLTGSQVTKVSVAINGLTHSWSPDVQILLVGPQGQKVVLMNDAGGQTVNTAPVNGVNLVFDDSAATGLPFNAQITSGTYKPSNFNTSENFADVAGPYSSSLSVFNTSLSNSSPDPNGTWSLYVQDDTAGNSGTIGSWSLSITTTQVVCCGAGQTFPTVLLTSTSDVNENQQNAIIANFTINDLETSPDSLTVSATSDNQALIPNANLVLQGSGANRSIKLTAPGVNQFGTANITVTVTDPQGHQGAATFTLHVIFVNQLPTISAIRNQAANIGTATAPIPFTVSDVETPANQLILVAASDNQAVVPNQNIFLTGPDNAGNATVQVVPASTSTTGQATISITVKDSNGGQTTTTFIVAFNTPAGFPTITPIGNQSVDENHVGQNHQVTVGFSVHSNSATPDGNLTLSASSSNTALLPLANIVFGGAGSERTAVVTPAVNQSGTSQVTITVLDPNNNHASSTTFTLTVNFINNNPTISAIANQEIPEGGSTAAIPFTINDVENGSNLSISVQSSDTTLLPSTPSSSGSPGFVLGGSGNNRTLQLIPSPKEFGKTAITVTVTDANGGTASTTFALFVDAVNQVPEFRTSSGAQATAIFQGVSATPVGLAANATDAPGGGALTIVEDNNNPSLTTPVDQTIVLNGVFPGPQNESTNNTQTVSIGVTSSDSNKLVVKSASVDQGSGIATIVVTPQLHASGSVVLTIVATDHPLDTTMPVLTTTRKITVLISPLNHAPVITAVSNQTLVTGNAIKVPITVTDLETAQTGLTISASSSNPSISVNVAPDNSALVITAASGFIGQGTITVQATDPGGLQSNVVQFQVNVIPQSPPPTISLSPTSATINEDTVAVTSLAFSVPNNDNFQFSQASSNVGLVPNENILLASGNTANTRNVLIIPAANANSGPALNNPAIITITIKDLATGITTNANFTLTVVPVNDAPTISLGGGFRPGNPPTSTATTDIGQPVSGTVSINDVDNPTTGLTLTATSSNTALVPNANIVRTDGGDASTQTRNFTITPVANMTGTAVITFTVSDGSLTASDTVTVVVQHTNHAPTIDQPAALNINEDAGHVSLTLTGIGNGEVNGVTTDLPLRLSASTSSPQITNVQITPVDITSQSTTTATLSFDTVTNQNGTATITISVADRNSSNTNLFDLTTTKTLTVNIAAVNDPPVAVAAPTATVNPDVTANQDGTFSVALFPNGTSSIIPVNVSDVDNDVSSLTASVPVNTSPVTVQLGGSAATRSIQFTAGAATGSGDVQLVYTDPAGGTSTPIVFHVAVNVPPQAPQITGLPAQVTVPPGGFSPVMNFTVNDFQSPATSLTVTAVSDQPALIPNDGLHIQLSGSGASRSLVLRSLQSLGIANIRVTVTDPDNNSTSVVVKAIVDTAPNISTPATAVTVPENGSSAPISITVSDAESQAAQLTLSGSSSNTGLVPNTNIVFSAITPNSDGTSGSATVTVTPLPNQVGTATITLTVTDPQTLTKSVSFTVSVQNTPPTISTIAPQSVAVNGSVTANFTVGDAETPAGSLTLAATSSNTTLVPAGNVTFGGSGSSRTVTVTPASNQAGTATITVTVSDGQGASTPTSFVVTVVNTPPTISAIPNQVILSNQSTGDLSFTVGDAESAASSLNVTASSDNATLTPAGGIVLSGTGANRSIRVTPAANQSGTAHITVTVTDPQGTPTSTVFLLTVKANTPPTISTIPDQSTKTNTPSGLISFTVGDVETPAGQLTVTATSSNQALVPDGNIFLGGSGANRTMFIVPANNQTGTAVITVTVNDGQLSTSTTFNFTVRGTPLPPTISSIPDQATTKNKSTSQAAFTVTDPDGSASAITLTGKSSDQTIVSDGHIFFGGSGTSRTVYVTPNFDATGTVTITVTATDSDGLTASTSFKVTIQANAATFDFNGDGHNDLVFEDNSGNVGAWFMNGANQVGATLLNPSNVGDPNWRIVGAGDFNGDGKPDLLFQHKDGTMALWYMNGTSLNAATLINPTPGQNDTNWVAVAVGDINGDGKPDILFQHTNGSLAAWLLDGVTLTSSQFLSPNNPGDTAWRLVGAGDFNSDKKLDLLFQHTDGTLAVWYMNGLTLTQPVFVNPFTPGDPKWRVASVADLDGDSKSDIIFQYADGTMAVWFMDGINLKSGGASLLNPSNPGGTWRIVAP